MPTDPVLVWFRRDLRVSDNPALTAAMESGRPLIALFVYDLEVDSPWAPGGASRWWLHHSLNSLQRNLHSLGVVLTVRIGDSVAELSAMVREQRVVSVFWNRHYEPSSRRQEDRMTGAIRALGSRSLSFPGNVWQEPWEIENSQGKPFQVFTPFWRVLRGTLGKVRLPLKPPVALRGVENPPRSVSVDELGLLPGLPWDSGLGERFSPGEEGGMEKLRRFLAALPRYAADRDFPGLEGTSMLSPHLHWGELSVNQILDELRRVDPEVAEPYLRQLGWREFAIHLLHAHPRMDCEPIRPHFQNFPWRDDPVALESWQRGMTGFPIVDAGMRELWATGYMHNRVRMIAASFLVKQLLLPWQKGASWFWDTLVDADLANNAMGWQWVAGSGADAAPYFRIFNPVTQSGRFDPHGEYILRWIPELAGVSGVLLHQPWMDDSLPEKCGYPRKSINLLEARWRALQAYATITK